ncbi:MAG: hypothetical protein MI865_12505, partial [Proteobacteria bacterium]|nr:hypothetical protein [Pseudomonadota bacterium]
MLKKIFTSLYRLIWYTFAIIIISAAVLVTAVRLALPGIGGYKEEIQSWVSEYMNYPVTIENINAEWQGWAPHLYLEQISLYTQNNNQLISNFDSAHIGIDLFASMTNREIVPTHLSVSGLSLDFTRNIDGSISISSDKDTNLNTNSNNETALSEWLLKQKYIIIENANLSWNDKRSAKNPIQFSGVTLELKTDNDRVQLDISLALPENHGKALYVKMDVVGNILTPNWDGTIYLEAKESKPTKLFKGFPIYSTGGTANLKFWTNWKHAKLRDFNAILEYENFSLNTKEFELPIQSIEVNALGKRSNNKDWTIKTIVQNLKTLNHYWPTAEYQFEVSKKDFEDIYKFDAHLSYINLDDAMPLIASSGVIPAGFFNGLDLDSLTGEFTDTYISIDPSTDASINFNLNTHFKDINISTHDKQYQAEGIDGSLHINENTVSVNLDSRLSKISLKPLFDEPLSFPEIIANVELVKDEIPKVYINEMNLSNKDFNIQSSGYIQFNEQSPFIDIVAHLGSTDIEKIPAFLPKQTDPELYEWLKQALVGGELSSGDLILRGNFSDFPFKKSEGHFKSILNISNATLEYNEGWPPIDNLDVEVIFENDDLFVTSNSGHIFDAKIENITAKVNGLSKVGNDFRIYVNSSIIGHTSDAQHAILQSPLQENTALMDFANSNVTGNINVNLDLDIPLGDEKSKVNGKLSFLDTMIESDLPGLGIEGVNGYVNFTRETIWAEGLDALYHGKPVVLSIPKNINEDEPGQFTLSGLADNEFLFNQLNSFFPSLFTTDSKIQNYVRGKSEWTLTINKEFTLDNKTIKTLELSSDLKGMAIDLPSPIGKSRDEVRSLTIKTRLKDSLIENIDIDYDNEIFGHFIIDNTQDVMIDKVLIGLGEKHSVNTQTNDISIEGNLEKLVLSEWADFILPKLDTNNGDKISPVSLDILVGNLSVFGNEF